MLLLFALILATPLSAFTESEPNNTPATSNDLGGGEGLTEGGVEGELAPDDADFFKIVVAQECVVAIRVLSAAPIRAFAAQGNSINALGLCSQSERKLEGGMELLLHIQAGKTVCLQVMRGKCDLDTEGQWFEESAPYEVLFRVGAGLQTLPALSVSNPNEGRENELLSIEPDASAQNQGVLRFSAVRLPEGAEFSPTTGEFSWTPGYRSAGEMSFVLIVTEYPQALGIAEVGCSSFAVVHLLIENVNRPPAVSTRSSITVDAGVVVSFSLTARDADGDALTCVIQLDDADLPATASWKQECFRWRTGAGDVGSHRLTFSATDGTDSGYTEVDIEVCLPAQENTAPYLLAPKVFVSPEALSPEIGFQATFEDREAGSSVSLVRVQVSNTDTFGSEGILWDSGAHELGAQVAYFGDDFYVWYGGNVLPCGVPLYWRIRVRDSGEAESAWVIGPTFTVPQRPQPAATGMPDAAVGADVAESPYSGEWDIDDADGMAVRFTIDQNSKLRILMTFSGEGRVLAQLWRAHPTISTSGYLLQVTSWDDWDSTATRMFKLHADQGGEYVLVIALRPDTTGNIDALIEANITKKPPAELPSGKIGDLDGDQEIEGSEPSQEASPTHPDEDWRTPSVPPAQSNPPASNCKWLVTIVYSDEQYARGIEDKALFTDRNWNFAPYNCRDRIEWVRRALGGFAHAKVELRVDNKRGKYEDGTDAPDSVAAGSRVARGFWQLDATWMGGCGDPTVAVTCNSTVLASCKVKANWVHAGWTGFFDGAAEYADITGYEVASAVARRVMCPEVGLSVASRLAWGAKWKDATWGGAYSIPEVSGDWLGSTIAIANWVLQHIQNASDEDSKEVEWVAAPGLIGQTGEMYDNDSKLAKVSSATVTVQAMAEAACSCSRPTGADSGWPQADAYNLVSATGRTGQMQVCISLICESGLGQACVGDIIRILYEMAPHDSHDSAAYNQDVTIRPNPVDPTKRGRVSDTPIALRKKPGSDSINEAKYEVKGEETE